MFVLELKRKINPTALILFSISLLIFVLFISLIVFGLFYLNADNKDFPLWIKLSLLILIGTLMFLFFVYDPYKSLRRRDNYILNEKQFNQKDIYKLSKEIEKEFLQKFEIKSATIQYNQMTNNGASFTAHFGVIDPLKISDMQNFISGSLEKRLEEQFYCELSEITFKIGYNIKYIYN